MIYFYIEGKLRVTRNCSGKNLTGGRFEPEWVATFTGMGGRFQPEYALKKAFRKT